MDLLLCLSASQRMLELKVITNGWGDFLQRFIVESRIHNLFISESCSGDEEPTQPQTIIDGGQRLSLFDSEILKNDYITSSRLMP